MDVKDGVPGAHEQLTNEIVIFIKSLESSNVLRGVVRVLQKPFHGGERVGYRSTSRVSKCDSEAWEEIRFNQRHVVRAKDVGAGYASISNSCNQRVVDRSGEGGEYSSRAKVSGRRGLSNSGRVKLNARELNGVLGGIEIQRQPRDGRACIRVVIASEVQFSSVGSEAEREVLRQAGGEKSAQRSVLQLANGGVGSYHAPNSIHSSNHKVVRHGGSSCKGR